MWRGIPVLLAPVIGWFIAPYIFDMSKPEPYPYHSQCCKCYAFIAEGEPHDKITWDGRTAFRLCWDCPLPEGFVRVKDLGGMRDVKGY